MSRSVFDLYTIGIGPSSSHTVGPMRAARAFADAVCAAALPAPVARVRIELYGSLGATGRGHQTDRAVLLGLLGERPDRVDPAEAAHRLAQLDRQGTLALAGGSCRVPFDADDLAFVPGETLPRHPNGMILAALDDHGRTLVEHVRYSVGGGAVIDDDGRTIGDDGRPVLDAAASGDDEPHRFDSAAELLAICDREELRISEVMWRNELTWRPAGEVRRRLIEIWRAMQAAARRGFATSGPLPGPLALDRRAGALRDRLDRHGAGVEPFHALDRVTAYALAVSEENAAGGRIVTAPTNGAAGIVPAVLHHLTDHLDHDTDADAVAFLLTAGAIGLLYKRNASISGAEVGCQGEVGVASSMAAGALCEALGGTPAQVENAAEIAMEHKLGLTCDPIGGLVQAPCIERNAMASVDAVHAARLALHGTGSHLVSLDAVIKTMRATGRDMHHIYKETSLGGLAVNVIEC